MNPTAPLTAEEEAEPAVPTGFAPLYNVKLLKAANVEVVIFVTFKSVIFTFSTLLVSVKRKVASEFPVEPITICPVGASVESAETVIVGVPPKVTAWPLKVVPAVIEIALYEIAPVPA